MRNQLTPTISLVILSFVHNIAMANSGGSLTAIDLSPTPHINNADRNAKIEITFNQPVLRSSLTARSFWAFGRWSGAVDGKFAFSNSDQTVALIPSRPFSAGEQVMVLLSGEIRADDGSPFRSTGLAYQFFVRAEPQPGFDMVEISELSTRSDPNISTRSYGGIATDLNEDGWIDITVVNEDTADLRTFLNRADSTGQFADFLNPPASVNDRASPSEPTDFDRDGHADICVVNIDTDSVSVLLGNGDGTFATQQQITVGDVPRGIAVLDVDGDGDTDIVNTNSGSSNLSLLINDGNGVFGKPTFFEGGGSGEWSLVAADMDNDNILDLVVGARNSETIIVNKCNGDGSFTAQSPHSVGGSTWMLACGDLDGDGDQDISSANSNDNSGSIILGDGRGGLGSPMTYPTDPFPLATDVADLDGDGDLDWVIASFLGDWFVFENDGSGNFLLHQEINAPIAASCSLAADIDNDLDLDLVLIDELEDVIIVMRNGGLTTSATTVTPIQGSIYSGQLFDAATSDDRYLKVVSTDSRPTNDSAVSFVVDGTVSLANPNSIDVILEAQANTASLMQTLEIYNWNLGKYEVLETVPAAFGSDSTQRIELADGIDDFIQPKTRVVRCRISFRQDGPVLLFPWQVCVDKFAWVEQ